MPLPSLQVILVALVVTTLLGAIVWTAYAENWWGTYVTHEVTDERVEEGPPNRFPGLVRWLTTVNHRDIGILYLVYSIVVFGASGAAVLIMRTELVTPKATLISIDLYNGLLTAHGLAMLLLFGTPIVFGFANYFIPLLVGASEMAFPRVNALAFWLLPPGALLVWSGFFFTPWKGGIEPATTTWTMYTPLSIQLNNTGVDLMLLGLHVTGLSSTMAAINVIVTVFTERAEQVSWGKLDIFSWTMLTTSGLILFAFPMLGSVILMLLLDRNFGTTFFASPDAGPILYQHLFWFFGHPEVYILILPPMGITSYLLPRFAGRKLFGFRAVVYSTLAIGVLSFGVWAHHMFVTGMNPRLRASFMAVTLAIAVPSAVKTFNWIATVYYSDLRLAAPALFVLGFVFNFIIGGITGVFLGSIPFDQLVHDTHFVVGHFHYLFMGGLVFTLFAAFYYWFPILTGRSYNTVLAHLHFWLSMIGTNVTFFALILLGLNGMPRRYATYLPRFDTLNQVATFGAFVIALGQVIWIINMVFSWRNGRRVTSGDPWGLEERGLLTREWIWYEQHRESHRQHHRQRGGESHGTETDSE